MAKGKIVLEKIENKSKRQVSFSKRKDGLFKKAQELAILCDAVIAIIVYSCSGQLHEYSSSRMEEILAKYNGVPESEPTNKNAATAENNQSQRKRSPLKGEMKILRRVLRSLRKKEVDGLTPID
ncbi:hypothetical protein P3S67_030229 [Capsicum chacoense]